MKYFWINLDKAVTRRNNMLLTFKQNNITDHYRVNAYLAKSQFKGDKENACTRSHIQALFHFVFETNDEYALICEDDLTFELKKYWRTDVDDVVKNAPNDWGIIQLATIIQNIEDKFGHRDLYFKWKDQKSSSCLAYVIKRGAAIELLQYYLNQNDVNKLSTADSFSGGIYQKLDIYTKYSSYTYKYPMFIYPDNNDTQLDNGLDLHIASKRGVLNYLNKHSKH